MRGGNVFQVARVVSDLDRAMKYVRSFRIGPWSVRSFAASDVRDSMDRGKPADFSSLVAVTGFRGDVPLKGAQHLRRAPRAEGGGFPRGAALPAIADVGSSQNPSRKYGGGRVLLPGHGKIFGPVIEFGEAEWTRAPMGKCPG